MTQIYQFQLTDGNGGTLIDPADDPTPVVIKQLCCKFRQRITAIHKRINGQMRQVYPLPQRPAQEQSA